MADTVYKFVDINGNEIEEKLHCIPEKHGLMCPEDKIKLKGIEEGANKTIVEIVESWKHTGESYYSDAEILDWIKEKNQEITVDVKKIEFPKDNSGNWYYNRKKNRTGLDGAIRRGLCYTHTKEGPPSALQESNVPRTDVVHHQV